MQLTLADISKKLAEGVIDRLFKIATNSSDCVQEISLSRAAPAGEGLIGAVYRIQVSGNHHFASFVAKSLVKDQLVRKSLQCAIYFKRETFFFTQVLPKLCAVQKELGAKERLQTSVPVCYEAYSDGEDDFIIMEDLTVSGLSAVPDPPTERDIELCLKVLAHLHATSMALRMHRPVEFENIKNSAPEVYFSEDRRSYFKKYLNNGINIDRKTLVEYEGMNSVYYERFGKLVGSDVYQQLLKLSTSPGIQPVMGHGDAWSFNFFTSTDRAAVIDFQLLRCCSPVLDVSFFITLCSNVCSTKELFRETADVYYNFLNYYMKDMGFDLSEIYTGADFWDEMKKYGKFGLLAALTTIPLMASPRCDVMDTFSQKFAGYDTVPLECLWPLKPIEGELHKRRLINAVHVHVDVGLI